MPQVPAAPDKRKWSKRKKRRRGGRREGRGGEGGEQEEKEEGDGEDEEGRKRRRRARRRRGTAALSTLSVVLAHHLVLCSLAELFLDLQGEEHRESALQEQGGSRSSAPHTSSLVKQNASLGSGSGEGAPHLQVRPEGLLQLLRAGIHGHVGRQEALRMRLVEAHQEGIRHSHPFPAREHIRPFK